MTQLSPITLIYDQVAIAISGILNRYNKGEYVTKEDILNDFNTTLVDVYEKVNSPKSQLQLFTKGEPPSSAKMNKYINTLMDDINVSAKQLDFLSAKAISVFNLFTSEVENEKKYSERIFSKTKILQLYSSSPANDIIYNGDSFENADYINYSKVNVNQNPMITNGSATVRIKNGSKSWLPNKVSVLKSNGFIGNNNVAIKKQNVVSGLNYEYNFFNSPSSSNVLNIIDSNPASYFVYEALNVEKSDGVDRSQLEFSYIVDDTTLVNAEKNSLINWSEHDMKEPLVLDILIESRVSQKANSITILPYFDSSKIIKIKKIEITDTAGVTENILSSEFYIGFSLEYLTNESFRNYSLNSATFFFSERNVKECRVIIEQVYYQDVEIAHNYWSTNYEFGNLDNSPFYGSSRFNPETLSKDLYNKVSYDKTLVAPMLTNPNIFKKDNILNQNIAVSILSNNQKNSSSLSEETFSIPLKINQEILPAKRMSIGIRDIGLSYQEYESAAEIVSKVYNFDVPVESIMLDVESNHSVIASTGGYIQAFISVDDGQNYMEISPVQEGYSYGVVSGSSIPEIIAFNQNIAEGFKLPGVMYLNSPRATINKVVYNIPKQVKSIVVKLRLVKGSTNLAPIVYSYKLAAKVKQI
jgi:hypothetical protein